VEAPLLRFVRRTRKTEHRHCVADPRDCPGICSLSACALAGQAAVVLHVRCPAADACRLRSLGVYEGAHVVVVDGRNGLVLDVRGSRLALDHRTAEYILVRPQGSAA
jgi:Fe2+ transport system protein FeoA